MPIKVNSNVVTTKAQPSPLGSLMGAAMGAAINSQVPGLGTALGLGGGGAAGGLAQVAQGLMSPGGGGASTSTLSAANTIGGLGTQLANTLGDPSGQIAGAVAQNAGEGGYLGARTEFGMPTHSAPQQITPPGYAPPQEHEQTHDAFSHKIDDLVSQGILDPQAAEHLKSNPQALQALMAMGQT